jgi:Rieske Fe-S protein
VLQATLGLLAGLSAAKHSTASKANGWLELRPPVQVPRQAVRSPWQTHSFEARFERKPGVAGVLDGLLLRLPHSPGSDDLKAFCTLCPHEICTVRLQQVRLPRDAGEKLHFLCPCHQSVFDPLADGALISGPAPRGLYRFAVTSSASTIDVVGVEEAALALFI